MLLLLLLLLCCLSGLCTAAVLLPAGWPLGPWPALRAAFTPCPLLLLPLLLLLLLLALRAIKWPEM
jgi:hypothetical protein